MCRLYALLYAPCTALPIPDIRYLVPGKLYQVGAVVAPTRARTPLSYDQVIEVTTAKKKYQKEEHFPST